MRRMQRVSLVVLASASLGACNDFLDATNPGAIEAEKLNDTRNITLMVNGVIGEYQRMFAWWNYYTGVFTDELRNHHVYFEERLIDRRDVTPINGTYSFFLYTPLYRAQFMADTVSSRLKVLLADSASRDVRLARTLAYAGQAHIMLGENLCEIPINMSKPYSPNEIFAFATQRFEEAITVAAAARAAAAAVTPATTASRAIVAAADSITNWSRVGAARAYLNMGDKAKAIQFASQVPAGFQFVAYYATSNFTGERNYLWDRLSTGSSGSTTGSLLYTPFLGVRDPRVPQPSVTQPVQNGERVIVPNAPSAYSTYSGTVEGAEFAQQSTIRMASHLEAQYIIAEAQGPTAATLAFVNARRTVGLQPAVTLSGDQLMAELREQRARDFYLDGHRLGDLRRYLSQGINLFQRGAYPGSTSGEQYVDQYCWPLTAAEIAQNPNIPK